MQRQFSAVDNLLTGEENLLLMGRLLHLPAAERRARAARLLERFDLVDAARRLPATYSGGMIRRLDIAMTLMGQPRPRRDDGNPRCRRSLEPVPHSAPGCGRRLRTLAAVPTDTWAAEALHNAIRELSAPAIDNHMAPLVQKKLLIWANPRSPTDQAESRWPQEVGRFRYDAPNPETAETLMPD